MDPAASPPKPAAADPPVLTWSQSVQLALGVLLIAGLFFLLGRWSNPQSAPAVSVEHAGPALDLNRATRAELRLLPGIGDALAQRIVEHRQRIGPFRNVDELRQIAGFGPKTLARLRPVLFVDVDDAPLLPQGMMATPANPPKSAKSKKASELTSPINVNRASQAELQKLPGIGPKLSQRIVGERAKARFQSIDDLRRVPGIGPKTLDKLRPYVTIDDARAVASADE